MNLPQFSLQGNKRFDFWLVEGNRDFAIIPANTIADIDRDIAIRLQVGDRFFGERHVIDRHKLWVNLLIERRMIEPVNSVASLVWLKLGQRGNIFSTESTDKIKIVMSISPDALMVLKYIDTGNDKFFTVLTLYKTTSRIDGMKIGTYLPRFRCK
jgi:hypothetical protein